MLVQAKLKGRDLKSIEHTRIHRFCAKRRSFSFVRPGCRPKESGISAPPGETAYEKGINIKGIKRVLILCMLSRGVLKKELLSRNFYMQGVEHISGYLPGKDGHNATVGLAAVFPVIPNCGIR